MRAAQTRPSLSVRSFRRSLSRRPVLTAAIAASLTTLYARSASADGTWEGAVVSFLPPYRSWLDPLNWHGGALPGPADPLYFGTCGDGMVDLGGAVQSSPSVTFGDWNTYGLTGSPPAGSTLKLTGATGPQITVGNTIQGTYGSEFFFNGNVISCNLDLESPGGTTVDFTGANGGVFAVLGAISGPSSLTLENSATTGNGDFYFADANAAYGGLVTVGSGTSARLLEGGRTGTGSVQLNGGHFDILSSTGAQAMGNTIDSTSGTVSADFDYSAAIPAPAPTTHMIGPVVLDNPGSLGGTTAASINFQADNEFNFESAGLFLFNTAGFAGPSRIVKVQNGDLRTGIDGSTLLTGPNNLNRVVVTTTVDSLFDLSGGVGLALTKTGGGVLAIGGGNETTSEGTKYVSGGTLRILTAKSYGTTTGIVGGPAVPVILDATGIPPVPAATPVSAAMGIGYPTAIPANLTTTGTVAGQSGAFDIDFIGDAAPLAEAIVNIGGAMTGLRIGSSGTGSLTGALTPYTDFGAGTSTYYLGGGGGFLTISSPLAAGPLGPAATSLEMGTSGTLLPGLVELTAGIGYVGSTKIKAGTLYIPAPFILAPTSVTHLGTYSTMLTTGGAYSGAPAATPYDGPGQLLLAAGGAYAYGPGGSFGGGGLHLDGGALGWDGSLVIPAVPAAAFGAPIPSTLYQSKSAALAPVAAHILHLGGEHSAGTMTVTFPIFDFGGVPVALLKSGISSTLDLTALPAANTATGGTGILGGIVMVDKPTQLGPGAIVISDGGILHVAPGGGPTVAFTQILRAANGPSRRSSVVGVDAGVTATFDAAPLEADAEQSVIEAGGLGVLDFLPPFLYPSSDPSNTWGLKMDAGVVEINQLPGIITPANGEALFAGGTLHVEGPASPSGIPIPAATQYSPNYGFSGISTFLTPASTLVIDDKAFFRVDGFNPSNLNGGLTVDMGPSSVYKVSGAPGGGTLDTSGTGSIDFSGGNIQFTPTDTHFLLPQDGVFSLHLNNGTTFAGCATSGINGNLYFNDDAGSTAVTINGATVDNTPTAFADTWTVAGTGLTSWNAGVTMDATQAVPGGGGPFVAGTVILNRCAGAPVNVAAGSVLTVNKGTFIAEGGTDPFTDNGTGATSGNHVAVVNNSAFKVLGVNATIESITGTGTLTVGDGVTTNTLHLAFGVGASSQDVLSIVGSSVLDLSNNHMFITYGGGPDPISSIRGWLTSGYAGGAWTGPGINTSAPLVVGGYSYGIGYADSADPGNPAALPAGTIEIKYTLLGDADLNGIVNGIDFGILAANFNHGVTGWDKGDFDYNNIVNGIDFGYLAANFNRGASGAAVGGPAWTDPALMAFAEANGLLADVPEPASIGLGIVGFSGLLLRRRPRRTCGPAA